MGIIITYAISVLISNVRLFFMISEANTIREPVDLSANVAKCYTEQIMTLYRDMVRATS